MTEPRGVGRPATGQTPVRTMRVGPIWDQAKQIADARGEKMTAVVEAALRSYVRKHQADLPAAADGAGETGEQVDQA